MEYANASGDSVMDYSEESRDTDDSDEMDIDADNEDMQGPKGCPPFLGFSNRQSKSDDDALLSLRHQNIRLQGQVKDLARKLERTCCCFHHESQEFPYFSKLPPELRRKIWRHALPGPRVVNFDFIYRPRQPMPHFEANYGAPTLLHVCHESREVALESYELLFQSKESSRPAIYFDLKRDTLCFTLETIPIRIVLFLEDMPRADIRRVRYLAVGTELPKDMVKYITQFHGLEVFSLILSDPRIIAPVGKFDLVEAEHRSIWVTGSHWNHGLTSWGSMEMNLKAAFEDEQEKHPDCNVPVVEFVYTVSTEVGCCKNCPGHSK
jgi:2EXR family